MYFRFSAIVVLLVAISLAAVAIEKQNLSLRRAQTLNEYRLQQLLDQRAALRVKQAELAARHEQQSATPSDPRRR